VCACVHACVHVYDWLDILNGIFAIAKWLYFFYTSISSEQLMDQPMYKYPLPKYSAEWILQILLNPNLGKEKICQKKPTNVTCSATFVVDTRKLQIPEDIKRMNLEFGSIPVHITSPNFSCHCGGGRVTMDREMCQWGYRKQCGSPPVSSLYSSI